MTFVEVQEAVNYIRSLTSFEPETGLILGTGLGQVAAEIEVEREIPYEDIPHFSVTTVQGHQGKLMLGYLNGKKVAGLVGRFHHYEGLNMMQVTFPVRVLKFLGVDLLIISNAAGGTNAEINAGDLVFIKDHINFHAENPLRGENDDRFGPRFPDMLETYDKKMNERALQLAREKGIRAHTGVYFGLPGPNLETPAEYRMINILGGDVVGMSTIPEVLVARHMGLRLFVVSVVTNRCFPIEELTPTTIEEVISVAQKAEPGLTMLIRELVREF